jgi:hypothetical protein
MRTILRRVVQLEGHYETQLFGKRPVAFRIVVTFAGRGPLDLTKSRCRRTLGDGGVFEMVYLEGPREQISDQDLEKFIATFPIELAVWQKTNAGAPA